jgi:hypothetical protein
LFLKDLKPLAALLAFEGFERGLRLFVPFVDLTAARGRFRLWPF